jgi:hypothetical protein
LLAREALVSNKRLERVVERFTKGHIPIVLSTLADGVQRGELRGDLSPIVLMMATMVLAVLPQIARRMVGKLPPFLDAPEPHALAQQLSGVLMKGLGPR